MPSLQDGQIVKMESQFAFYLRQLKQTEFPQHIKLKGLLFLRLYYLRQKEQFIKDIINNLRNFIYKYFIIKLKYKSINNLIIEII